MENFVLLAFGIIILLLLWEYVWKTVILKLHVSFVTVLFDDIYEFYLEKDNTKIDHIISIYNKAANTPRDFDINEFMIIINDMKPVDTESLYKDEDKRILEFADNCAMSMYSCLRMRSARHFIYDICSLISLLFQCGFRGGFRKLLGSIDKTSSKNFLAHS